MTADIALTLAIAALALLLFMLEWLPADITGMVVMVTLMLLGQVTPAEGISGFSNPATLTVMAMFILSAGIARTGALQRLNQALIYWSGKQPAQQMLMVLFVLTTVLTGILSKYRHRHPAILGGRTNRRNPKHYPSNRHGRDYLCRLQQLHVPHRLSNQHHGLRRRRVSLFRLCQSWWSPVPDYGSGRATPGELALWPIESRRHRSKMTHPMATTVC